MICKRCSDPRCKRANQSRRAMRIVQTGAAAAAMGLIGAKASASIFQWQYVNPSDPSQGKIQSATLTPGGSGVNATPNANLASRNLTQAYLIGANLSGANLTSATLTNADTSNA